MMTQISIITFLTIFVINVFNMNPVGIRNLSSFADKYGLNPHFAYFRHSAQKKGLLLSRKIL